MTEATPAQEAETGATPLSDVLAGRHQGTPDHQPHEEAGAQPPEPAPTPAPSAPPAMAETAAPAASPAPAQAAPAPAGEPEGQNHPFWYRKELKRLKDENARLAAERNHQPPPQPARADPQGEALPPDPVQVYVTSQLQQAQLVARLERSEERLADKHGDETVEEVREWLATRSDLEQWAMGQRDPWRAAHEQYQREKLAAEIGTDPKAYEQRLRDKILAELAQQQGHEPAPAPTPQMRGPTASPPPMASAARSAAPRDPATGQFTGPTPLKSALKHG